MRALPLAAAVGALVACVLSFALPAGPLRVDPGQVVEVETAYQTVRVVEATETSHVPGRHDLLEWSGAPVRARFLRFDEDTGSYQSLHLLDPPPGALTSGRYYDHLALSLWFDGMPWTRDGGARPRVLIVGYAGGTLARIFQAVAPPGSGADVVGVEVDERVPPLALSHLDPKGHLPPAATVVGGEDGRTYVNALGEHERFDLVIVDAYQRTQYVPFQVATVEFFRACLRRLAPNGAIGFNVNVPKGVRGRLVRAVAATLETALAAEGGGAVFVVPNPHYLTNAAVWGTRSERAPRPVARLPESLAVPAMALERLLVRHTTSVDGGIVLTDDHAPTERLADEEMYEEAE